MKPGDYYLDTADTGDGAHIVVVLAAGGAVRVQNYHDGAEATHPASDFGDGKRFTPVRPSGTSRIPSGALAELQQEDRDP